MEYTAQYKYFVADIITGKVTQEIPFSNVTWERKINSAGSFSGSIAGTSKKSTSEIDHFNLYESTLPGKYALYVMRNNVCVWGGIIWSRDYDIISKQLSVSALEFVSYLHHRMFWKTFDTDMYQASGNSISGSDADTIKTFLETLITYMSNDQKDIEQDELAYGASDVHCRLSSYSYDSSGNVTITTRYEPCEFSAGDDVYIYGVPDNNLNGIYPVTSVSADKYTFTYNNPDLLGNTLSTTSISEVTNAYVIKNSTRELLISNANVRITTDISTELDNYVTNASGDENVFSFRGDKAEYVGDILQRLSSSGIPCKPVTARADIDPEYSIKFDYYIESSFDSTTQTFNNVFKAWLVKQDINNPTYSGSKDVTELYGYSGQNATNYIFEHPGNIVSFSLSESADSASTRTWMIDSKNDLGDAAKKYYGSYTNVPYLSINFPIIETAVTGVDLNVAQDRDVAKFAKKYSSKLSPPIGKYSVNVNGSMHPKVGTYKPGDWCIILSDDDFIYARMKPPFENRTGMLVRKIRGFSVSVPDNPAFPETVTLDIVAEWEDGA